MVYEKKKVFEACLNKEYICPGNSITQLYFTLGRVDLHSNFSSLLRDALDIHRIPTLKSPHKCQNRMMLL